MSATHKRVEITFVHQGRFHSQTAKVPWAGRDQHKTLIDFLANDPAVQRECFINFAYVCSAVVLDE